MSLDGKTIIITGSTRGIGREMALRFARDHSNIVILGKTIKPHSKLDGTIFSVADEVRSLGAHAYPIELDLRDDFKYPQIIEKIVKKFGHIHVLINNASALHMSKMEETSTNKYDLIHSVNSRATFLFSQACLPYLLKESCSDILTVSPPINLNTKEFSRCPAYTMSKYSMSMVTIALSKSYSKNGLRANSIWPNTTLATAAIKNNFPYPFYAASRHPRIMADAAYEILTNVDPTFSGHFYLMIRFWSILV